MRTPRIWNRFSPEDMKLPEGKTCGDCGHFSHCKVLIQAIPEDQMCDWSPSRFTLALKTRAGSVLSQAVEQEISKEEPLPEYKPNKKTQARIDEEKAVLIKPQPKSGGTYEGWEI